MPKGQRRQKIDKVKNGAKGLRDPINSLIDDSDDYGERICDLEEEKGDIETIVLVKNGIVYYGTLRMSIGDPVPNPL